jgi:Methyltransferase domain
MTDATVDSADAKLGHSGAWQRFWATGAVDTFGSPLKALSAPVGPDSPPLVAHWRRWMVDLPDQGALLDVGTGNGVLLSHLLIALPQSRLRGVGFDLTRPTIGWLDAFPADQRSRIEVHGGVGAESLPFPASSFAACTSQFGIEYADMTRAVPEALRVLQPNARIGWVIHHDGGRPARLAREELDHIHWLHGQGWLDALEQMVRAIASGSVSPTTPAAQAPARAAFDRLVVDLRERAAESACPDVLHDVMGWTGQCLGLAQRNAAATGLEAIVRVRQTLDDIRHRLLDLTEHAVDESRWNYLLAQIRARGVVPHADTGPLFDRGHLMGWWLSASVFA